MLSVDINHVNICIWTRLQHCCDSKKVTFGNYFLNNDIFLNNACRYLKFKTCILNSHSEGTVSQSFDLGSSFYFMIYRRKCLKNVQKSYPFFVIK